MEISLRKLDNLKLVNKSKTMSSSDAEKKNLWLKEQVDVKTAQEKKHFKRFISSK